MSLQSLGEQQVSFVLPLYTTLLPNHILDSSLLPNHILNSTLPNHIFKSTLLPNTPLGAKLGLCRSIIYSKLGAGGG